MSADDHPDGTRFASNARPGLESWGRLRHLFVETLNKSIDPGRRIALIDPSNPSSPFRPWDDLEFPENLTPWVERYHRIGERGAYLWRWCLFAVDLITLSSVDSLLLPTVRDLKFLVGMFNCLIDDVVDESHNHRFFQSLLRLTRGGVPQGETPHEIQLAIFAKELWAEIWSRASQLPRFAEFQPLLSFDLLQLCNTVEHSDLTLQLPELLNPIEHDMYSPHGMMVTVAATIDLMGSQSFQRKDLAVLRSILWHAESMARIGNMVSTWEREIAVGDFTSGVFMEAAWRGVIRVEDLRCDNGDWLVQQILGAQIESAFLSRWEVHREQVRELGQKLESIGIDDYVERLDMLIESEIFSHGQK